MERKIYRSLRKVGEIRGVDESHERRGQGGIETV